MRELYAWDSGMFYNGLVRLIYVSKYAYGIGASPTLTVREIMLAALSYPGKHTRP